MKIKIGNSDPRKELIISIRYKSNKLFRKQLKLLRRYRVSMWVNERYLKRDLERSKLVSFLVRKLFKRVSEENLNQLLSVSISDMSYCEAKAKKLKDL